MQHNNLNRTGANLKETILNTSSVNQSQFGKLWSYPISGQVYAQPLYVTGVNIPHIGIRNILYVADMHNDVYAFDADRDTQYWKVNLGPSVTLPDNNFVYSSYSDIKQEIGICSTPTIDLTTGTIYIVAKSHLSSNIFADSLYALDITTGLNKFGSPVNIQAKVSGTAYKSNGTVTFNAAKQNQRAALVLSNGIVYLTYASYGDGDKYEGWILGYNANNIRDQAVVFNDDPNGQRPNSNNTVYYARGGIWMSGQGPAVDSSGNLYVITGNGAFDSTQDNKNDFADSFLKLTPDTLNKTFIISDWFTPHNEYYLDSKDLDLGSDGPVLIPNSNYITASCKQGIIYLIDKNNMSHFHMDSDLIRQQIYAFGASHEVHGSTVYWADNSFNPNTGLTYWWPQGEKLQSFRITNGLYNKVPTAVGPSSPFGTPGGILSLSANGSKPESGILWVCIPISANAGPATVPGMLRAFDASNVSNELWNSQMNPSRDSLGNFAKFCPPTIANGKVYIATFSNKVQVYGLEVDLPVNLITFTGQKENNSCRLSWTTSFEKQNDRFEIERSNNAIDFEKIGSVVGASTSDIQQQYAFYDNSPMNGINFYRLKQVDINGKSTFSRIISVDFDQYEENFFTIYPNPAKNQFSLILNNWSAPKINLKMVSMTGDIVFQTSLTDRNLKGANYTINRTSSMGDGIYLIYLTDGEGEVRIAKILLVH